MTPIPRIYLAWREKRVVCKDIIDNCGAPSLKKDFSYMDRMLRMSPSGKMIFKTYANDTAFVVAYIGRAHLRIFGLAVKRNAQRRGIGKMILRDVFAFAKSRGLQRVTLRANIAERADVYYETQFAFIRDGRKGNDYEMHKEI